MATFLSLLQSVAGAKLGHKGVFTAFSFLHIEELRASLVQTPQNDLFSNCLPASCLQSSRAGAGAQPQHHACCRGDTLILHRSLSSESTITDGARPGQRARHQAGLSPSAFGFITKCAFSQGHWSLGHVPAVIRIFSSVNNSSSLQGNGANTQPQATED